MMMKGKFNTSNIRSSRNGLSPKIPNQRSWKRENRKCFSFQSPIIRNAKSPATKKINLPFVNSQKKENKLNLSKKNTILRPQTKHFELKVNNIKKMKALKDMKATKTFKIDKRKGYKVKKTFGDKMSWPYNQTQSLFD